MWSNKFIPLMSTTRYTSKNVFGYYNSKQPRCWRVFCFSFIVVKKIDLSDFTIFTYSCIEYLENINFYIKIIFNKFYYNVVFLRIIVDLSHASKPS